MLKKIYDKSEIWFAVGWIIAYCLLLSVGDALSALIGIEKSVTLVVAVLLSSLLILFLKKHNLFEKYGLCAPKEKGKSMLFYIPVVIMLTANFWCGVTAKYGILETILYILAMLCVGFLEEIIFRGLLFNAMRKDSIKAAIIVSSLTFGMGHIINLINVSGADLLSNFLQILYATTAGFMFVMIYTKTESLLICIASHGVFNALDAFSGEAAESTEAMVFTATLLTIITGSYAFYLAMSLKKST